LFADVSSSSTFYSEGGKHVQRAFSSWACDELTAIGQSDDIKLHHPRIAFKPSYSRQPLPTATGRAGTGLKYIPPGLFSASVQFQPEKVFVLEAEGCRQLLLKPELINPSGKKIGM
jgi:hypothetical protein